AVELVDLAPHVPEDAGEEGAGRPVSGVHHDARLEGVGELRLELGDVGGHDVPLLHRSPAGGETGLGDPAVAREDRVAAGGPAPATELDAVVGDRIVAARDHGPAVRLEMEHGE